MSISFPPNFQSLFKLPIHVYWKDKLFRYLGCNDAMAENLSLNANSDIIGKLDQETIVGQETAKLYQMQDQAIFSSVSPMHFIDIGRYKNNKMMAFATYKLPLFDQNSQLTAVLGISVSIDNPFYLTACEHLQVNGNFNNTQPVKSFTYVQHESCTKLSRRELECIRLSARGLSASAIGVKLELSKRTVEDYIERAKNKLNCNTKSELIEYVLSNHLLDI